MSESFDASRPIYAQLVERLKAKILAGTYPPGGHLDSVRDLAAAAGVNPNTMQRALAELEQSGLLRAERTAGRFVTDDTALIAAVRKNLAREKIQSFIRDLTVLGFQKEEIIALMKETMEGGEKHD